MIDQLVDRDYFTVHVSAAIAEVTEGLRERNCFAVLNDNFDVLGIITLTELRDQAFQNLGQVNFTRPVLTPHTSFKKAIRVMRSSGNTLLPVYHGKQFVGTLSLIDLAEHLVQKSNQVRRKQSLKKTGQP